MRLCRDMLHSTKSMNFSWIYYFLIIGKCLRGLDETVLRAGFVRSLETPWFKHSTLCRAFQQIKSINRKIRKFCFHNFAWVIVSLEELDVLTNGTQNFYWQTCSILAIIELSLLLFLLSWYSVSGIVISRGCRQFL